MARNWQYPRWRRLLMQSAMWVILGGTVGLAALLDRHQHEAARIGLAAPVQCGSIRLQVPLHWLIQFSSPGMVSATESGTYPPQYVLEVTVAPPAEAGLVDDLLRREKPSAPMQTVSFGSGGTATGNLYIWQEPVDEDGVPRAFAQVIATATLPSGPEVTIRLQHLARNSDSLEVEDDIDLVKRISATVQFSASDESTDQNQ